jgi:hypothetical protein
MQLLWMLRLKGAQSSPARLARYLLQFKAAHNSVLVKQRTKVLLLQAYSCIQEPDNHLILQLIPVLAVE